MSFTGGTLQVIYAAALLIAILLLAAILYWVVRRMLARGTILSSEGGQRGKRTRLAVIDSFDVDRQRRLVLLRRDNVEHLVMIGGPNDLLIEATIRRVAAQPSRPASTPGQPVPSSPPMAQQRAAAKEAPLPAARCGKRGSASGGAARRTGPRRAGDAGAASGALGQSREPVAPGRSARPARAAMVATAARRGG